MRGTIRYQKELQKTYMIAEQCKKELIESYAGQMVLRSSLEGLVPCEMQLLDGKREIWYDISFLQTVEQVFAVKDMHFPDLKNVILQILSVIEETEKYLIDSRQLCFEPEYLYWDMEKEQVKFLYNYTEEETGSGMNALAAFLLERTCHEEEKAVDLAYYFYEQTQKENFYLEKIEAYVGEAEGKKDTETEKRKEEPEEPGGNLEETVMDTVPEKKRTEKEKKETKPRVSFWNDKSGVLIEAGLAASVTALLSGIGFAVTKQYFFLEQMEELLWLAGSVLLFTSGLSFFAYGMLKKRIEGEKAEGKTKNHIEKESEKEQKQEDSLWEELDLWQQEEQPAAQENTDGKTVYLGKEMMNREYRLVEMKKGLEKAHNIPQYPFLIGKDREKVNLTVKEHSVSRIHARLTEEEGNIYVEDLHSTNGTYLNDLLLEPHRKMKLKRGDIILFGNAEFVFR